MTTTETDRVGMRGQVSQVQPPAEARALSTLARIDYEDAFMVDAGNERTAQQWVRAVFNDAPLIVRARLVSGWIGLGLKLGAPWSARRVLGWRVQQSTPNVMLLAADSLLGLQAQLLFRTDECGLLFATFIQQNNPVARAVWVRVTPTHHRVVHSLLDHAARREGAESQVVSADRL